VVLVTTRWRQHGARRLGRWTPLTAIAAALAVASSVLVGGVVRGQQPLPPAGTPTSEPVAPAASPTHTTPVHTHPGPAGRPGGPATFNGLRKVLAEARMRDARQMAEAIGPPPGDCRVDVTHAEDKLSMGLAAFVVDVFTFAGWKVEDSRSEEPAAGEPHILIRFTPSTAKAATQLQAGLSRRERTDTEPVPADRKRGCWLGVSVSPQ
jgi:hypothetical protein